MTIQTTADQLLRATPDVMAAPKDDGPVTMLCFRPGRNLRSFPDRLTFTRAEGIPGDRWLTEPWLRQADGSPDPRIQVSILPTRVLDLVWRDRVNTVHPGDSIIADLDLSEANLPVGSLLRAGSAVLRVSDEPNFGCVKWKTRYGTDALAWCASPDHQPLRLRGVLCSVEEDGEVAVGDRLVILR